MIYKLNKSSWFLEDVSNLSSGNNKTVIVVCPVCGEERTSRFCRVSKRGRTTCKKCLDQRACIDMIGKKYGKLTAVSVAEKDDRGKRKGNYVNAVCECGMKVVAPADRVRSGEKKSCGCFMLESKIGANNPSYNSELTEEERAARHGSGLVVWSRNVKKRDGFVCQICGSPDTLVAHHLNGFRNNAEYRLDLNNGITLCSECHIDFHINFMGGYRIPVTREDFEEYLEQI